MADATAASDEATGQAPQRAGLVLISLILVADVANLNLSVAKVALPDVGKHFDFSPTTLDLIAVGYSLGVAASVLHLGALGDRFGRRLFCFAPASAARDAVGSVGAAAMPATLLGRFGSGDARRPSGPGGPATVVRS